jgi:hypothetical protein
VYRSGQCAARAGCWRRLGSVAVDADSREFTPDFYIHIPLAFPAWNLPYDRAKDGERCKPHRFNEEENVNV